MKIAIMQPYFFPNIGYFQLVSAVNKFIFYDDVNFIKNGWINRNKILINNKPNYFGLELKNASSNKLINEVQFTDNRHKLRKTIQITYKKAPYFEKVWPIIKSCLEPETNLIYHLAIKSVKEVSEYLQVQPVFEVSGKNYPDTKGLEKTTRILSICKRNNATDYLNPSGGTRLYSRQAFAERGISLGFIKPGEIKYPQYNQSFIPELSIIDVLMFNSKEKVKGFLKNFEVV